MKKFQILPKIFKIIFLLFVFILIVYMSYWAGLSDIEVRDFNDLKKIDIKKINLTDIELYDLAELEIIKDLKFVKKLVKNKRVSENAQKLAEKDVDTQSYNFVGLDKNRNTIILSGAGGSEDVRLKTNSGTFLVCFKDRKSVEQSRINFSDDSKKLSNILDTLYSFDETFFNKIKGNYTQVKVSEDGYVVAVLVGPCK